MYIKLQDLDVRHLDLDLPEGDLTTSLRFEHITDGRGTIATDATGTTLEEIVIREVLLSILALPLGPGATLRTTTPAMVANATMDGRVEDGLVGTLRFGLVNTEALTFDAGELSAKSDFRTEEVSLVLEKGGGRAALGTVSLRDGLTNAGGFATALASLALTGFKVSWQETVRVEALKAHAHNLTTERENVRLSIAGVDLPEGFVIDDGVVTIPQLLIGQATLVIDDLLGEARAVDASREVDLTDDDAPDGADEAAAEGPAAKSREACFDPGILDTLNGQLDVDLTLSATVPVLGRRTATHHFRVPIDGGIINYRDLERDLADLEDAFIDVTLRGDTLVLERDIPLIPGLEKPILLWDLGAGDVELAKQHLVRLRTLPDFRLPASSDSSKKSKLKIHRLDFDGVAIALSVDDGAVVTTGDGSLRVSLDALEVSGSVHHQPDTELAPTALEMAARGLTAVARDLALGSTTVERAELRLGAVERATLSFEGLKPRRLELELRNLSVTDLAVRL